MKYKFLFLLLAGMMSWMARAAVIPERVHCKVEPVYGYKADRSAGRLVSVSVYGKELRGKLWLDVSCKGIKETSAYEVDAADSVSVELLLPSSLPADKRVVVGVTVRGEGVSVKEKLWWSRCDTGQCIFTIIPTWI